MGDTRAPEPAERLERIAESQALLADVSRNLGPALHLDTTVKAVLHAMRRLVDFRGGSICLVDGGSVSIAASDPAVSEEVLALRLPVGTGIAGRVVTSGRTIYVPDLDDDQRVDPEVRAMGSNAGMTSYLGVPLVCLGEVIGLLQVDSGEREAFDDVDVMLLEGLAAQTANAIQSARLVDEMARVDSLKRGFINLVSHELRTPLTIASGMVKTYRSLREGEPDELDALLERSDAALSRLGRLIEELILMSQLSAGEVRPHPTLVSVGEVLAEVVRAVDAESVSIHCRPDLAVVTDGDLLGRALAALVENAVVYAGHADVVADGTVIEVRDRGPGLPAELTGREYETFNRATSEHTTAAGLGLGLHLANALVGELGGELDVESTSSGTVVRISLPTAPAALSPS